MRMGLAAAGLAAMLIGAAPVAAQAPDVARIVQFWAQSAHADASATAFTRWNSEGEIPPNCARCHSGEGFRAFHGLDRSAPGVVEHPVATGGVIDCDTCHAPGSADLGPVSFPSGVTLSAGPANATCMTCHQGTRAGTGVRTALEGMEPDTVNPELSFLNPHYAAAAATLFGTEAKGPYEYEGRDYAGRLEHAPEVSDCTTCHNPHSLQVAVETCAGCHQTDVTTAIRVSSVDHDGDGDTTEGMAGEIATLSAQLRSVILDHALRVTGTGLVYAADTFPYFFTDLNGDGVADPEELQRDNAFRAWTPRLLAAAYNYQFIAKDPGAYAHNPRYAIQVLIDSIADLSEDGAEGLTRP